MAISVGERNEASEEVISNCDTGGDEMIGVEAVGRVSTASEACSELGRAMFAGTSLDMSIPTREPGKARRAFFFR